MKTKKGFTLIELIVVIAIIGVLAAILVPSMLGYVKKSKIQSANTTASSIYKALNSALTELDEEDGELPTDGAHVIDGKKFSSTTGGTGSGTSSFEAEPFFKSVKQYFSDITKVKENNGKCQIRDGMCIAVAVKSGKYYGTYPTGVVTAKKWGTSGEVGSSTDIDVVLAKAVAKAGS